MKRRNKETQQRREAKEEKNTTDLVDVLVVFGLFASLWAKPCRQKGPKQHYETIPCTIFLLCCWLWCFRSCHPKPEWRKMTLASTFFGWFLPFFGFCLSVSLAPLYFIFFVCFVVSDVVFWCFFHSLPFFFFPLFFVKFEEKAGRKKESKMKARKNDKEQKTKKRKKKQMREIKEE